METAAVLEHSEPNAAPAIVAPAEQAPIMTLSSYGGKLTREQLSRVHTPSATATHKPIPHIQVGFSGMRRGTAVLAPWLVK